jgi:periplasmic protein TonB
MVSLADQLEDAIEMMIADPESEAPKVDLKIGELLGIATELRLSPDPAFRAALKAELVGVHRGSGRRRNLRPQVVEQLQPRHKQAEAILPSLFGAGYGSYPVHRSNFAISLVAHAAAIVLIATAGGWISPKPELTTTSVALVTDVSPYTLPLATEKAGGGGGGGDRDKIAESKGSLPRFTREQIAPPEMVVRNEDPKLPSEPTVVGPPALTIPATSQIGNPLSAVLLPPSNGIGSGSGIGSGTGGGIGSGNGPGVGPGSGGGIGGGVYRVGGGVSAPRAIYDPDPEYSEEARKAKYQGKVLLWVIVGPDGRTRDIRVERSLGMGLDEKAIEAVRKWKFEPSLKDGRPVAVQVNIEVSFRLY